MKCRNKNCRKKLTEENGQFFCQSCGLTFLYVGYNVYLERDGKDFTLWNKGAERSLSISFLIEKFEKLNLEEVVKRNFEFIFKDFLYKEYFEKLEIEGLIFEIKKDSVCFERENTTYDIKFELIKQITNTTQVFEIKSKYTFIFHKDIDTINIY